MIKLIGITASTIFINILSQINIIILYINLPKKIIKYLFQHTNVNRHKQKTLINSLLDIFNL